MTVSAQELSRKIAQGFVERSLALELKGKRRDDEALTYFIGASQALDALAHEHAQHIKTIAVLVVATRGYSGVCQLQG